MSAGRLQRPRWRDFAALALVGALGIGAHCPGLGILAPAVPAALELARELAELEPRLDAATDPDRRAAGGTLVQQCRLATREAAERPDDAAALARAAELIRELRALVAELAPDGG